jgi:rubrerythrin
MRLHAIALVVLCALWPATGFTQPGAAPQQTIDNLNAAIHGEANAAHRYTLFARKADEEGHRQVAKLFRAAALAESIHQKNHEQVLRGLGLEPKRPVIEHVKVGTTRENLEVPIKGEREEQDETYPAFVKQARRDNVPAATRSFTFALNTEAQHHKLFEDALARLGRNPSTDYYVGQVSGDTVTEPTDREPYKKIE